MWTDTRIDQCDSFVQSPKDSEASLIQKRGQEKKRTDNKPAEDLA